MLELPYYKPGEFPLNCLNFNAAHGETSTADTYDSNAYPLFTL